MAHSVRDESLESGKLSLADGDREFDARNLDSALRYYTHARQIFRESGAAAFEAMTLLRMTYVYEQRSETSRACQLASDACEILRKGEDPAILSEAESRYKQLTKSLS